MTQHKSLSRLAAKRRRERLGPPAGKPQPLQMPIRVVVYKPRRCVGCGGEVQYRGGCESCNHERAAK